MSDRSPISFPAGFLWGAATAAYQIEGSPLADGAGPNIWHRFSHTAGRTHEGHTGDVACDHYRRADEDVALMRELGLDAYRFSIAWARILPEGRGRVNPAGLAFYDRLVDRLLASSIQPFVTLYHWDLPAALDDRGGWLNPDIAGWFAEYARVVFEALGDRVTTWVTLNEPWVITDAGYLTGVHAPGHANLFEAPLAAHNLLRAHGAAVQAYRSVRRDRIGIVVNLEPKDPSSQSPEDLAATQRADVYMNYQYLEPVFKGRYPEGLAEIYGEAWPRFSEDDMAQICQPIDFLGINYYTRGVMQNDPATPPVRARRVTVEGGWCTETGWEVAPESLTRCLCWVTERYGRIPIYVTENGAAIADPPTAIDGTVEDPLRVDYYRRHLTAAYRAMERGVDLRGYFAWSLLDNYEWACGYSKRFGLIHVDYATQKRTIKASGRFYREVIRTNGAVLGVPRPLREQ